jgi:hypothetical protein
LFRSAGLDLNFAGGVFSLNNTRTASPAAIPGWSFSRTDTNGTATALDLAGNVIQFATGVPRITNRGILVEEARTNLLLNSATLSTQTVTTTAVAHTLSFYGTGTVTLTGASTAGPLVGTGANNRVTLTFTPIVGPLLLTVTGSVTLAQVEVGAFATSPIITTGAAGTRGVDSAGNTFSIAAGQDFTFYGEIEFTQNTSAVQSLAYFSDGTDANRIRIYRSAAGAFVADGRVALGADVSFGSFAGKTGARTVKAALSRVGTTYTFVVDGVSSAGGALAAMPALTSVQIGATRLLALVANDPVRRIRVLPYAATNAQLQALTAP